GQPVVLDQGRSQKPALFADAHHPCLGSGHALPYSAGRGKKSMSRQALDELKQQIALLDYLQAQDWRPARKLSRGRLMGQCPLHEDQNQVFRADPPKTLSSCYGCGGGGEVFPSADLYPRVKSPQAWVIPRQCLGLPPLLGEATDFYRVQLHRHSEA